MAKNKQKNTHTPTRNIVLSSEKRDEFPLSAYRNLLSPLSNLFVKSQNLIKKEIRVVTISKKKNTSLFVNYKIVQKKNENETKHYSNNKIIQKNDWIQMYTFVVAIHIHTHT